MLEELGLGEADTPDEADVVVFNTCTIREKPDQRLAAHSAQAKARKQRDPDTVIAVGGCYAEAQRDRIFELYPQVDVAFGPGTISHLGEWLGAGGVGVARGRFGIAEERDFAAELPQHNERRFQAWVQVSMGCNSTCSYCIVPAVRGRELSRRPGEILAEVTRSRATESARSRCSGRTSTPRAAISRRGPHRVRGAAARRRRGRRHRADPLHEPAPEGLPPRRDRGDGRVRGRLRARAPAAPVRLVAHPEGHAPHVHARALPAARRRSARRDPRPRARHRHHRRLSRRDRGRLPRDARGRRGGRATTARSRSSTRPAHGTDAAAMPDRCPKT